MHAHFDSLRRFIFPTDPKRRRLFLEPDAAARDAEHVSALYPDPPPANGPPKAHKTETQIEYEELEKRDLSWSSSEHARLSAELDALDLLEGDEGRELLASLENVILALGTYQRATDAKTTQVNATLARLADIEEHVRVRYGVGLSHSASLQSVRHRAWAKIRKVISSMAAESGTDNAESPGFFQGVAVAFGPTIQAARVARLNGNAPARSASSKLAPVVPPSEAPSAPSAAASSPDLSTSSR